MLMKMINEDSLWSTFISEYTKVVAQNTKEETGEADEIYKQEKVRVFHSKQT